VFGHAFDETSEDLRNDLAASLLAVNALDPRKDPVAALFLRQDVYLTAGVDNDEL